MFIFSSFTYPTEPNMVILKENISFIIDTFYEIRQFKAKNSNIIIDDCL